MGIGGISIWQLLIVLGIIILIFGTKKLRTLGADLGGALKGFKSAMKEGEKEEGTTAVQQPLPKQSGDDVIDVTAEKTSSNSSEQR